MQCNRVGEGGHVIRKNAIKEKLVNIMMQLWKVQAVTTSFGSLTPLTKHDDKL